MEIMCKSEQIISDVAAGSAAERAGLAAGDALLSINGESVCDLVDYEYLTANERLTLAVRRADGKKRAIQIKKDAYEPLGLTFASSLMDRMRYCKNRCVFCFIDQMPKGVRTSLHVKDDDWRMSFIMGNYVSLTNVDDAELSRIIARRVSPLYVSLHAANPAVRARMMGNPRAGEILAQLNRLKDAGLRFHLQIVLCPGLNDGDVLTESLAAAENLFPAAQSLAIVPVGLTRFREGLFPLRRYTGAECAAIIDHIAPMQADFLARFGTRFVFLSDEWYLQAGKDLPTFDEYEDFAQIENGVGLMRLFEDDFFRALSEETPRSEKRRFVMAGGKLAAPYFRKTYEALLPYGVTIDARAIENTYFGGEVTVAGLITGGDLVSQLVGADFGAGLLIPRCMLKADEDVFLDGMTLAEVENALQTKLLPVRSGEELIQTVFCR